MRLTLTSLALLLALPAGAEEWTFPGRFDAGGFGVGSDYSYQIKLNLAYRMRERASLIFGYRLLDKVPERMPGKTI